MTAKAAEELWVKAHERIKEGDLAQAVRDLAKAYEILKALRDPRIGQVHKRWVEVHKLYRDRKAKEAAQPAQPAQPARAAQQPAEAAQPVVEQAEERYRRQEEELRRRESEPMSLEQRAETAANQGNLDEAIALYRQVIAAQPENELARERVRELEAASARARQLSQPPRAAGPTPAPAVGNTPEAQVAFLEGLLQQVQERRRSL